MIQFSAALATVLDNPTIEPIYLVDIGEGEYRLTSHYGNVQMTDGRLFYSNGLLINVDAPQQSSIVDREEYKIVLADPDFSFAQNYPTVLIGARVEVRVTFVDPATDNYLNSIADTLLIYKGVVEGAAYKVVTESAGESQLVITCTSPMANLEFVNTILLDKGFIRSKYPTDTCCDQVYEGSGQITLRWGKN
jgi:hypothetical protein